MINEVVKTAKSFSNKKLNESHHPREYVDLEKNHEDNLHVPNTNASNADAGAISMSLLSPSKIETIVHNALSEQQVLTCEEGGTKKKKINVKDLVKLAVGKKNLDVKHAKSIAFDELPQQIRKSNTDTSMDNLNKNTSQSDSGCNEGGTIV